MIHDLRGNQILWLTTGVSWTLDQIFWCLCSWCRPVSPNLLSVSLIWWTSPFRRTFSLTFSSWNFRSLLNRFTSSTPPTVLLCFIVSYLNSLLGCLTIFSSTNDTGFISLLSLHLPVLSVRFFLYRMGILHQRIPICLPYFPYHVTNTETLIHNPIYYWGFLKM